MDTREALLAEVEAFLQRERMAPTALGKLSVNDGKFVRRLRSGANLTLATVERVEAFMRGAAAGCSDVFGPAPSEAGKERAP